MFGNLEEIQKQMKAQLEAEEVTGTAGDGKISVTVNGAKVVKNISIDPALIAERDPEELEDLLLVAINRAMEQADVVAAQQTQNLMSGLLPPGMDLGGLFGK
ncbi:MAG: YbaB/EbfC family nucleoid-associated protein [Bacteroidota bacterium]